MGANVFIYTYRGYGLSSGEPSKAGILTDADTAMAYLMSRSDVDSRRVVAYGYSMGGLPTSYLVGRSSWRGQFAAVVLESALDGPESTVNLSTGTEFPRGFFLDEDTLFFGPGYMKGASLPILHLHGQQDGRVVLAQAENYYAVLKGRPEYTHYIGRSNRPGEEWIARCGHRNITSWAFDSDMAIAHFWDSSDNPGHCCLHPLEWLHDENADFIQRAGGTTGAAAYAAAMDYQQLVTQWLQSVLP
jgi:pimeloyl-ACP methyl ester carboxylesterase